MAEISALEVALRLTGIDLVLEGLGALVGVFGDAVKSAIDFQTELTQIQNNTTMTAADMGALSSGVLQLAQDTGVATDVLGTGYMKAMNIAGNAAAAMAILTVATESAVSTGGNAASTTNVLANAMHEYGLDLVKAADGTLDLAAVQANAAHVMGVMHLAAAEGNMTLEQFSESSGKSIGIAANLGVSLEDVSAAFAALTKHGFDAAQSGTQVTDMLTHMINPTKAQIKELERVSALTGVNLVADFSATGLHTKGLTGVLADLTTAYRAMGLTEAEAEQESMKLINAQRGGLGLASLLGTGAADYASILADLDNQTRVNAITEESYNRTRETVGNQWARLQQIAHATAITVGGELLPALSRVLGGFIPLAQSVGPRVLGVMADFREVLGGGFGAGTVGGTLAIGFLLIKDSITNRVIPALQLLWRSFFPPGNVDWPGLLQKGVLGLASGVETLARWFQLGIDGIVTFKQAAAGDWFNNGSPNAFVNLLGRIGLAVGDVFRAFQAGGAGGGFGRLWAGYIQPALLNAWDGLRGWLGQLGGWLVGTAAPAVGRWLWHLGLRFGTWVNESAIPFLRANLPLWLDALGQWRDSTAMPFITSSLAAMGKAFGDWITIDAIPWLRKNLPRWIDTLGVWMDTVALPFVGTMLSWLGKAFGDWVTNDAIPWLTIKLPGWIAALGQWYTTTAAPFVRTNLADLGKAFGEWVTTDAIPWLKLKLPEWLAAFEVWITGTAVPWAATALEGVGKNLALGLANGLLGGLPDWAKKLLGITATASVGGAVGGTGTGTGASGGALGGGTGGGLGGDGGFTPTSRAPQPIIINNYMSGPTTPELAQSMADHLFNAVSAYLAPGGGPVSA